MSSSRLWTSSSPSYYWNATIISLLLAGLSLAVATAMVLKHNDNNPPSNRPRQGGRQGEENESIEQQQCHGKSLRFACLGNSIQYYNDCPRLLEHLCRLAGYDVTQDSCLRGGATMASLWKKGNGMKDKFILGPAMRALKHDFGALTVKDLLTAQSQWDYVIINDHTQWPARENSREESLVVLKEHYVPLLKQCQAVPIFIMTAGYRVPDIRETDDLGDFDHYTQLLKEGNAIYKEKMDSWLLLPNDKQTRIAPVGLAYALVYHSDRELWYRLYDPDNFHPSPLGTLLQTFVLYITMTGEAPPSDYQENWWDRARRMQPPDENPMPLPSTKEVSTLRRIAMEICYQVGLTTVTLPSNEEAEKMRQVAMQVCGIHEQ